MDRLQAIERLRNIGLDIVNLCIKHNIDADDGEVRFFSDKETGEKYVEIKVSCRLHFAEL